MDPRYNPNAGNFFTSNAPSNTGGYPSQSSAPFQYPQQPQNSQYASNSQYSQDPQYSQYSQNPLHAQSTQYNQPQPYPTYTQIQNPGGNFPSAGNTSRANCRAQAYENNPSSTFAVPNNGHPPPSQPQFQYNTNAGNAYQPSGSQAAMPPPPPQAPNAKTWPSSLPGSSGLPQRPQSRPIRRKGNYQGPLVRTRQGPLDQNWADNWVRLSQHEAPIDQWQWGYHSERPDGPFRPFSEFPQPWIPDPNPLAAPPPRPTPPLMLPAEALLVGSIVWLPNMYQSTWPENIPCVLETKLHNPILSNPPPLEEHFRIDCYWHPWVILRVRHNPASTIEDDLLCDVALVTTFAKTLLDVVKKGDEKTIKKFKLSVPIRQQGAQNQDKETQLDLVPGSVLTTHQSYVMVAHIRRIHVCNLWPYRFDKNAYDVRLTEESYNYLMRQFGQTPEPYWSVEFFWQNYRDIMEAMRWKNPSLLPPGVQMHPAHFDPRYLNNFGPNPGPQRQPMPPPVYNQQPPMIGNNFGPGPSPQFQHGPYSSQYQGTGQQQPPVGNQTQWQTGSQQSSVGTQGQWQPVNQQGSAPAYFPAQNTQGYQNSGYGNAGQSDPVGNQNTQGGGYGYVNQSQYAQLPLSRPQYQPAPQQHYNHPQAPGPGVAGSSSYAGSSNYNNQSNYAPGYDPFGPPPGGYN